MYLSGSLGALHACITRASSCTSSQASKYFSHSESLLRVSSSEFHSFDNFVGQLQDHNQLGALELTIREYNCGAFAANNPTEEEPVGEKSSREPSSGVEADEVKPEIGVNPEDNNRFPAGCRSIVGLDLPSVF